MFDPRNLSPAAQINGLAPTVIEASDNARGLMHGIFVGEIQALEGAGRTCFDFDIGDGARAGAVRSEARHGPAVLGRGPPRRDQLQAQRAHGRGDR